MPADARILAPIPAGIVEARVRLALEEDLGDPPRDVTTAASLPPGLMAEARLVARSAGVVAGLEVAAEAFRQVDSSLAFRPDVADGDAVTEGAIIARVAGPLPGLLAGERVALNFLQRLSGVATMTRRYVEAAAPVAILDTRKTTPGLRSLEKHAVRAGGGVSHRSGLHDAILIKDNHVAAAGGVAEAVRRARSAALPIEVEVDTLAQLAEALEAAADVILLDNMTPAQVRQAVVTTAGRALLEVSGGVTLATVGDYASTGVDRISVGALTHSAPALDISMEVTRTWQS